MKSRSGNFFLLATMLFFISSCKLDTLQKMTKAANVEVVYLGNQGDSYKCLKESLWGLDFDLRHQLSKKNRQKLVDILKNKITRIELNSDVLSRKVTGTESRLYYVTPMDYAETNFNEIGFKVFNSTLSDSGKGPRIIATKEGTVLKITARYMLNDSIIKKYYTKSVNTFDQITTLEEAVNSTAVWSPQTYNPGPEVKCPEFISLEKFVKVIEE